MLCNHTVFGAPHVAAPTEPSCLFTSCPAAPNTTHTALQPRSSTFNSKALNGAAPSNRVSSAISGTSEARAAVLSNQITDLGATNSDDDDDEALAAMCCSEAAGDTRATGCSRGPPRMLNVKSQGSPEVGGAGRHCKARSRHVHLLNGLFLQSQGVLILLSPCQGQQGSFVCCRSRLRVAVLSESGVVLVR